MGSRSLVAFWIPGVLFFLNHCGAGLAQIAAAEAATVQGLHQNHCWIDSGSEEKKEVAISVAKVEATPQFQRSRAPTISEKGGKDDLVLQKLSETELREIRKVPNMRPALDKGMDGTKEKDKESKPTSAEDEGSQREQRGGRKPRCLSGPSSLDGNDAPLSSSSNSERRSKQGSAGVRHATSPDTTSASSTNCCYFGKFQCNDSGRDKDFGSPERGYEHELGALGTASPSFEDPGIQRESHNFCQAIDPCAPQQTRQDQEAGCGQCEKGSSGRPRVEQLYEQSFRQSSKPCRSLSATQSQPDPGLQFESGRTTKAQSGAVAGIPINAGEELGYHRDCRRDQFRCRPSEIPIHPDQCHGGSYRSGRTNGGGAGDQQWRGKCRVGNRQQAQIESEASLPSISVTHPSGKSESESQAGDQGNWIAEFGEATSLDHDYGFQDAEDDMNRFFAQPFSWNVMDRCEVGVSGMARISEDVESELGYKHVRFADDMQVRFCCEDGSEDSLDVWVQLQTNYFRFMWDLDGQYVSWNVCRAVCRKFQAGLNFSQIVGGKDVGDDAYASLNETHENTEGQSTVQEHVDAASSNEHLGRLVTGGIAQESERRFIDTWFVSPLAVPVCTVSRRVRLQTADSDEVVQEKILSRWSDLIDESACRFHEVLQDHETGSCRKIIVTQHLPENARVALLRYDGFPPLQKTRAVCFDFGSTAHQIVRVVGLPRICDRTDIRCLLEYYYDGSEQRAETHDLIFIDHPVVFNAHVMILQNQDSQSDDEDTSDEPTRMPSVESESTGWEPPDDDVISLAGFRPSWIHFQPNIPDPAQMMQDFLDEGDANVEDADEDMLDGIHVLTHQWGEVLEAFRIAVETAGNAPFLIVTFGLGLIDLGRRDTWCTAREFDRILEHIRHLWSDHAQFAELQVILVKPQPDLQIGYPHVIVIVEVLYVEIGHPARGVPILVHETGDTAAVRTWYAAHVSRSESATTILHSLQREQDVHPYGVRDAIIHLGAGAIPKYDFVQIEEGSFCTIWFSSYPLHVAAAADCVSNAEALFIDVRTFTESSDEVHVECIFHGISPQNRPLGDRSIWLPFHAFHVGNWYEQARAVWPFPARNAKILYVERTIEGKGVEDRHPVFHFILCYGEDPGKIPILVRQSVYAVESGTSHSETWAVRVSDGISPSQIVANLPGSLFWTQYPERVRVSSNGNNEWVSAGDAVELKIKTHRTTNILDFLTIDVEHDDVPESTSFLQLGAQKSHISAFHEVCASIVDLDDDEYALAGSKSEGSAVDVGVTSVCRVPETVDTVDPQEDQCNDDCHNDCEGRHTLPENEVLLAQRIANLDRPDTPVETVTARPVTISLEAVLPVGSRGVHAEEVSFQWFDRGDWEDFCKNVPAVELTDLPDGLQVKPTTYHMLTASTDWKAVPSLTMVFVDGAAKFDKASWSFAVVETDGWVQSFKGCAYGEVQLCPEELDWCGADGVDNLSGELTALVMAQNWILKQPNAGRFILMPDLMLSRNIAKLMSTCRAHPNLVKLARVQAAWLGTKCDYMHVKGHAEFAWNELADSLASFSLKFGCKSFDCFPSDLHELAGSKDDLNWVWMQDMQNPMNRCFPPLFQEQFAFFPPSLCKVGSKVVRECEQPDWKMINFTAITANVLAMDPKAEVDTLGRQNASRTIRLDQQWHEMSVHLVGVQEARTQAGRWQSEHYHIISGGADFSHTAVLGCELWFHKSLKILTGNDDESFALAEAPVVVQFADPRRLMVQFDLGSCRLEVIVLHVPIAKAQDSEGCLEAWWTETQRLINANKCDCMTIYLVDANAPLATHESEYVGMAGAEAMNPAGDAFERFLHDEQLYAPTTMEWCHSGVHATWTHPRGQRLRRDYVLVNKSLFPFVQSSKVIHDHDNTFAHEDHLPVLIEVRGWIEVAKAKQRIKWDYEKLRDPVRCKQFAEALASLPIPTWEVHIDSHCQIYEEQLLQLGRQYFEQTKKQKPRPTLSEEAQALIALKRSCLDYGRSTGELCQPDFRAEMRSLENQVRKLVWRDSRVFFDKLLDQIDEANGLSDHRTVFKTLVRFGSRKAKQSHAGRPLPLLKNDRGEFARNFQEQQQIWVKQFAEVEAGEQVHWDVLEQLNRSGLGVSPGEHDLAMIPNEYQIEQIISKLKRQKATGPNEIPTDVLKAAPAVVSKQLACLYTKAAAHAKEPLCWKGGFVAPLYKKGPVSLASSYRSIFISNYTAKIYHATIRQQLLQVWQQAIDHIQLGGRPSCGADTAHHWIQVHSRWAAFQGLAQGLLFFDLKSAFYTVLRQSLTDVEDDGHAVIVAMIRMGLKPDDVVAMINKAKAESATAGLSRHGSLILKDALTNTHFQIRGSHTPVMTHRGTRPGDPLADILFNLTMHMLLTEVKQLMSEANDATWIGSTQERLDIDQPRPVECPAYVDISYVDDVVVAMHGFSNEDVQSMATACVDAFRIAAGKRGLLLNFEQGKTELLWSVRGQGSWSVRERLALDGNCLRWEHQGVHTELRVVKAYKHLGTWVQEKGKHGREIRQRGSATAASWGPLAKPFYRKKQVALQTKTRVFESLTMSRLLFNVHIWTGLSDDDFNKWQNALRRPLFSLVKGQTYNIAPFRLTVEQLAGLAGMAAPLDLVHAARLRYLKRFLANGHQMLWNLLWDSRGAENNWIDLCRESFRWLKNFCPHKLPLDGDADFVEWLQFTMLDESWKGRVKAALRSCKSYRIAYAKQQVWEMHFEDRLISVGVAPKPEQSLKVDAWQCELCGQTYRNKRALAMHSKHQHGYRALVKYYAAGDTCPCCLKWYHCRARFKTHLTTSVRCLDTLMACFPAMPEAEVEDWDNADRERNRALKAEGWWATKALQPVLQVQGPQLPPWGSQDAADMKSKVQARSDEPGGAYQMLQGRCIADPSLDEGSACTNDNDLPGVVMHSAGGMEAGNGQLDEGGLARIYARLSLRCMAFVHFFSGYRRDGDLHQVLQEYSDGNGGILFVISCDHKASQFWFDRIKCETFSAARLQAGGPPPVRDLGNLFGLPALKPAQWKQVEIGSALVRFIEEVLLLLSMMGGCGFAEHPSWPAWAAKKRPCSIWVTKPMKLLRKLKSTTVVTFDQCVMNAEIRKPTTLILVRLRSLRSDILQLGCSGRCNHGPNAHVKLSGKDEDGSYKTSRGKVYPPRMNLLIGRAIVRYIHEYHGMNFNGEKLPDEFDRFNVNIFSDNHTVQPDYYG